MERNTQNFVFQNTKKELKTITTGPLAGLLLYLTNKNILRIRRISQRICSFKQQAYLRFLIRLLLLI